MPRILAWFSCGAASAVNAKLCVEKYGSDCEVLYCDTFAYEHPDNRRFFDQVQDWLGVEIKILRSPRYRDIYDVFYSTGYLVGPAGARCTTELKKNVRKRYQHVDDIQSLGYTAEEKTRITRLRNEFWETKWIFPLYSNRLTKYRCKQRIADAGIALPAMYRLGFENNNCIGCVKGGMGYWNRIRVHFPGMFWKMASAERDLNVAINKRYIDGKRVRIFLDELDPDAGLREPVEPMDCGVICQ